MFKGSILIIILLVIASCSGSQEGNSTLHIATAANMQFAMDSISLLFEKEYGIECEIISNSSGMLTAQIEKGAPFDIFVSANMTYPDRLIKSALADSTFIYAFGRLAFIFNKEDNYNSIEEVIASEKIKRIAIADPETAPYGASTIEYLKDEGLFDQYKDKIIYGESINQVNQYITTGAVDAAFTSFSFVTKYHKKYNVIEVPSHKYADIKQGVVILKQGMNNNPVESKKFVEFLKSATCQRILKHFGYRIN